MNLVDTTPVEIRLRERQWPPFLLAATIFLLAGFLLFGPTGRDDVYKTLWPAKTFGDSFQILNYNGDALEQSSSLLHVVVLGTLGRMLPLNLPDLNFILLIVCGLWSIGLAIKLSLDLGIRSQWLYALILGGQPIFIYWSMGGLDAAMATLCWLLFLAKSNRFMQNGKIWSLMFTVPIVVMVRPEGFLIAGFALALPICFSFFTPKANRCSSIERKRLLQIWGIIAFTSIALATWRDWYTGNWLPQPVMAKSGGFGFAKFRDGLRYFYLESYRHPELLAMWVAAVVACFRLLAAGEKTMARTLTVLLVAAGLGFVCFSGGDWMENGRFFVPYLPILLIVFFLEAERLPSRLQKGVLCGMAILTFCGLLSTAKYHNTGYPLFQSPDYINTSHKTLPFTEIHNRVHLRDVRPLEALRVATHQIYSIKKAPVSILSQQAGMMMFHLAESDFGKFRFIDLVGLCTADFSQCALTKDRGNFRGGLNMDLFYFINDLPNLTSKCGIEAPDIIFSLDNSQNSISKHLEVNGYEIYYSQSGRMPDTNAWFPGMEMEAVEFIAVKREWPDSARIETEKR